MQTESRPAGLPADLPVVYVGLTRDVERFIKETRAPQAPSAQTPEHLCGRGCVRFVCVGRFHMLPRWREMWDYLQAMEATGSVVETADAMLKARAQ